MLQSMPIARRIFATKPVERYQQEASGQALVRTLGLPALVAFGIGSIIGTGIFVLTGLAAAQHAGPAVVVSFLVAGIASMFAGLCYSELAAMVPVAGSAYAYTYATLGEFIAWFVGWNLILEYMMTAGTVAVGWSSYFVKLLDHYQLNFIPGYLSAAPLEAVGTGFSLHATGALVNLPAVAIIVAATALCYKGIKESSLVNIVVVVIKVAIVIAFIVFGLKYVQPSLWQPLIPKNTGEFGAFGTSGIAMAAAVIFFAYIGFDGVSTVAQEAKNPRRTMPAGILLSLAICAVLYIAMARVLTGLVPYEKLNDAAPVAVALEAHPQLLWLWPWVIWGTLFGLTSVIITMIIPQARIWLTMAQDGLLPPAFGAIHPKFRTPHISTAITGIAAAIFGGLFPIDLLGELVSIGTLVAFAVVCIGVLVLRHTRPDLERPFRVPVVWLIAPAGIISCAGMAYSLPNTTWIRLAVWSVLGIVIYALYGYTHSRLRTAPAFKQRLPVPADPAR
jgi:APA family basic amino acid/polyamine antiporter